ncbi:hypothetical protein Ndes2526A_g06546 [Nannochloris sp. 'desiccata']
MCLLLPCAGAATWGGWKIQKSLDKAFSSSSTSAQPREPTESVIVTEAKLAFKLASFKPSSSGAGASTSTTAPPTQGPPARTTSKKKVSKKEEASKARLQELIDQYAPKK